MLGTGSSSAMKSVEDANNPKVVVKGLVMEIVASVLMNKEGELVPRVIDESREHRHRIPQPRGEDMRSSKEWTRKKRERVGDQHFNRMGKDTGSCNGRLEGVMELVDRLVQRWMMHRVVRVKEADLFNDHKDQEIADHLCQ